MCTLLLLPFSGLCRLQYNCNRLGPVWTSLARDYLPIMASSVSSERAFSQGGITVSKCHSRLKGDIVEALQCVKCSIRHDLIFQEPGPSSALETECDDDNSVEEKDGKEQEDNEGSWDTVLQDDDGDEDFDIDLDSSSDIK